METTTHTFSVTIDRDDRDQPIHAGFVTFSGEAFDFDASAARERLIADGRLRIGPDLVTFQEAVVPLGKVDRVRVELTARSRPPTLEEAQAFAKSQAEARARVSG